MRKLRSPPTMTKKKKKMVNDLAGVKSKHKAALSTIWKVGMVSGKDKVKQNLTILTQFSL